MCPQCCHVVSFLRFVVSDCPRVHYVCGTTPIPVSMRFIEKHMVGLEVSRSSYQN